MVAITHEGSYGWRDDSLPSNMRFPVPMKFGPFLFGGNRPIHDLLLIEVTHHGVYLTFGQGAKLVKGAVFRIVRPLARHDDPVLSPGQARKIVAVVQIQEVGKVGSALVRVIRGSVISGTGAEMAGGKSL